MSEIRLIEDGSPLKDSAAFHRHMENVPHLDNGMGHVPRLTRVAELAKELGAKTVVDLGACDGGLLSLLEVEKAWGYDVRKDSVAKARPGTDVREADVLTDDLDLDADLAIACEILEHLDDPGQLLRRIAQDGPKTLITSSPYNETREKHSATHVWAWDVEGYTALHARNGWSVLRVVKVGRHQILVSTRE